jgi:hypothetical protein
MTLRFFVPALLIVVQSMATLEVVLDGQIAQHWKCDVDLHQGDVGTLQFTVMGTAVEGTLVDTRGPGAAPVTTNVRGSWADDVVRFTRSLSATSEQPFVGIAARDGDRPVKMAGRFAAGFDGIWSATCSRTAGTRGDVRGDTRPVPPRREEPATPPDQSTGSCTISGAATGPRADLAQVFQLVLYGPDNDRLARARQHFGQAYLFKNLPDGRYVIVPDTKADVAVSVSPRRQVVQCRGGSLTGANFDFR